ncbi:MAG: hypothetical protein ACREQL_02625 [Candidatus Binatia bacterium]
MSADIHREADELWRYYSELGRRLSQAGVRDVADLLALHDQLKRALAAVSAHEIRWALDQTQQLIETLVRMDSDLQALRALKGALEKQGG